MTNADTLAQSLAAARAASRISGQKNSYRKDNPGEYAEVIAYLDGGARPTRSLTKMGEHLVLEEDVRRALIPPPPPPSANQLLYTPPGYPDYAGYTTIHLTNASARRTLSAGVDYRVIFDEVITVDGGVMLNGGRNVVIIGGEISDSNVLTQAQASANELWRQIGLYLPNSSGIVHVEGLWIHGNGCGDAIEIGNGANAHLADIRVQNCRLHNNHDVQNPSTTGWNGSHPDTFQCYDGPRYWRFYQLTCISSGTLRTWQPQQFDVNPILGVEMRRMNILAQQKYGAYALWDDYTQAAWPEVHEDIWFSYGQSGNFHRNTDITHAQFDPPNGNISGEAIKYGVRPEGDWVPDPTTPGNSTACGMNYVSPGYQ